MSVPAQPDGDYYSALYVVHYASLVRLAALLRDDTFGCEDVVREAYIKLAANGRLDRRRDPDAGLAYLRTVVVKRSRSSVRRRPALAKRTATVDRVDHLDDSVVQAVDETAIIRAMRALPRRMREAVVWRCYAELSEVQTADLMRASTGAVASAMSRGLGRLGDQDGDEADNGHLAPRVREQLQQALSRLDPVGPALAVLRSGAVRRKRIRRAASAIVVLAVAIAAVAVAGTTGSATGPTRQSLVRYADAHGGRDIGGPFAASLGTYGVFSTRQAIVVVAYTGTQWQLDGPAVTTLGKGRYVSGLDLGPRVGSAEAPPSIAVRIRGSDVTYLGAVLWRATDGWRSAEFDACGHHGLCYPETNFESFGHTTGSDFTSMSNDCTPDCADGTVYNVTWRWSDAQQRFVAIAEGAAQN